MFGEKKMEAAISKWLQRPYVLVARQVRLDNVRFDVVAYNKKLGVFQVVECKPTSRQAGIGGAFGQIATYSDKILRMPDEFVDSASRKGKLGMRFRRWMEATDRGQRIRVQFYVALKHEALADISRTRDFKARYPNFGIIRYKKDGTCKLFVREKGKPNHELTRAEPLTFQLRGRWPSPAAISAT